MVTPYTAVDEYQSQKNDIDTIHLLDWQTYPAFISCYMYSFVCVCMWIVLFNLTLCVYSCAHHSQNAEQFDHHKKNSLYFSIVVILTCPTTVLVLFQLLICFLFILLSFQEYYLYRLKQNLSFWDRMVFFTKHNALEIHPSCYVYH